VSYSTSEIAEMIGCKRQDINYYIKKGHLKSTKIEGRYKISQEDFFNFRENYFLAGDRFSSRGVSKKLTVGDLSQIKLMLIDAKIDTISLDEFGEKYKSCKKLNIFKDLMNFKRDSLIKKDRKEQQLSYEDLSTKYRLSTVSIRRILQEENTSNDN
jgi:ribosome-binding protein aMBF1 (putative translation factor)